MNVDLLARPTPSEMRRLVRLAYALGVLAVAMAAVAAYFAVRSSTERERVATLEARIAALQDRPSTPGAAASPDAAEASASAGVSARVAASERESDAALQLQLHALREQGQAERREVIRRLREDLGYRSAVLAGNERALRRRHEGVEAALGLSPAETRAFYALLAEERLRQFEEQLLVAADHVAAGAGADPKPFAERSSAVERETAARLRDRLGDARYEQWLEFERDAPAREIARDVRDSTAGVGDPLRPEQERRVAAAIAIELDADRAWARAQTERLSQLGRVQDSDMTRIADEMLMRREAAHRRLHAALAPALSPTQLARLDEMLAQQLMLERAQMQRSGMPLGLEEHSFTWTEALGAEDR